MKSNPIASYSVYAVSIIDPETGVLAGKPIEVLESSSLNISGENVNLMGGANRFPWEIESGDITAEIQLAFSEYPSYLTKFLLGASVEDVTASTGEVSEILAGVGTSMLDATNGISTIVPSVANVANLKTTKYFLKAKSATTADLYAVSDIDFEAGVEKTFINDNGLIVEDIDLSATATIADFGLDITIVGVPAFEIGDTIEFEVIGNNEGGYTFDVGSSSSKFPEFAAVIYAELSSTGQFFELTCYRCQATGMPLGFNRKAFGTSEVTAGLKYDSSRGKVYRGRQLKLD